ncbi:hypothetical protein ACFYXQ_44590 [Nocardia jiangxiensis]|uniref:Uncharacterized protein n=1 Tax=Nocardia jiangxiensis TaxID=282685 RepID=A0ABW6SEU3_9NOCA
MTYFCAELRHSRYASPLPIREPMHDDPELAQARNFLNELRQHAHMLMRRRESTQSPSEPPIPGPDAELAAVRRQIEQLYTRFPALRADAAPRPI